MVTYFLFDQARFVNVIWSTSSFLSVDIGSVESRLSWNPLVILILLARVTNIEPA